MSVDLLGFFRPANFFDFRPAAMSREMAMTLLILFGILVVMALLMKILQSVKKREHFLEKLFSQYFECFLVFGLLGAFWLWLRYERVIFLAARFWLVIWFIGFLTRLFFIWRYQFKVVPRAKEHSAQKKIFNKYLPEKKK